ncbi:uncharacterized protein LOC132197700 [Neocloeon triangulifer]|uniref:uncharacterized protein LOC132197700 n=1 Tax=Neocloeon triangulifer TaxID=2078957 RepID=UPI00286F1942|nr:uncharacterized protein LOC132197700 [Neocloeon triangulifer]XP_059477151.1 uncharacterized protein LOC132197700 [Neocloeon triangulifer]XP_059477153.1 uncharacterized protein LOC132197700 [Neocloeon triangulifer]XP_059477154.1 uncharacterized protein LOC132197700 [Neocloeon triangulifer]
MIGAMPAVAVRHERRKQDKKKSRPGHLYLANYANKQATSSGKSSPCPSRGGSPSPGSAGGGLSPIVTTPPHAAESPQTEEFYVCAKVSTLHVIVVSYLLGIILLIVGLVQLKPGADASDHRFYILGAGSVLLALGTLLSVARCVMVPIRRCLHKRRARIRRMRKEESAALALTKSPAQNGSSSSTPAHPLPHHHHHHHQQKTSHDIIQEMPSAEERAAADPSPAATSARNGATLTQSQSVSIEIETHSSSKDTLVSTAKSPSENDHQLQQKRPSVAKT